MADNFADLWNLSNPSQSSSSSTTLSSATQRTAPSTRKPQQDVFALLSSAGSSASNSRSITPSSVSKSTASQAHEPKGSSADAFSGLFAGSLVRGLQNDANLTIAERAALAEKTRREQVNKDPIPVKSEISAWDGLDTLAKPPSNQTHDRFTQSHTAFNRNGGIKSAVDDWGLADFVSKPTSRSVEPAAPTQAILDMDDLPSPIPHHQPAVNEPVERFDTLGDFDFGDREDNDARDDSQDEDDLLGVLSKPIDSNRKQTSLAIPSNRATPSPQPPTSRPLSRPVSPPPHVLGQIVEMGFSVEQARVALACTDTGLDVQAALETLLSNGAASKPPSTHNRRLDEPSPQRRSSRPGPPSRTAREHANRETPSPAGSQQDKSTQADKILAQASEIGLSVFNRANAFWNQSKEKVQKAYEERAKPTTQSGSSHPARPRWLQSDARDTEADEFPSTREGGYSDGFSPVEPMFAAASKAEPQVQGCEQPKTEDVFSQERVVYVPPSRRGRRPRTEPLEESIPASSSNPPPPRVPSPVKLIQRQTVSASPSLLTSSAKYKSIGTDKFKLGQYAEAEAAYTAAIAVLPESHLLLIPLYNNRALTRIKTGDHTGAVDDCSAVITLIGPKYNPRTEAKVEKEEEGASVRLADALVKAWKRRAEAHEGKEKWAAAQSDWEAIIAADWAGGKLRTEAIQNAGRCRRMCNSGPSMSSPPADTRPLTKTTAPRPPKPVAPTVLSEAQIKVRRAHQAQEAEDEARLELKDTVEARLMAWKGGKESNLRALIASLDTVLWSELGWQKVGMAELVTPSQVKIRYTKAIAKLHPDKLSSKNITLEQRMIANGVFGALNEAWNAFKQ